MMYFTALLIFATGVMVGIEATIRQLKAACRMEQAQLTLSKIRMEAL